MKVLRNSFPFGREFCRVRLERSCEAVDVAGEAILVGWDLTRGVPTGADLATWPSWPLRSW